MKKKIFIISSILGLGAAMVLNVIYCNETTFILVVLAVILTTMAFVSGKSSWWKVGVMTITSFIVAAVLGCMAGRLLNDDAQIFMLKEAKTFFVISMLSFGIIGAACTYFGFKVKDRSWLIYIAGGFAIISISVLGSDLALDWLSKGANSMLWKGFIVSLILVIVGFFIQPKNPELKEKQ